MKDQKIKVLGIAPFESMKVLMVTVAKRFPEIELSAYVGDLDAGVQIVRERKENYDLIISRGGTAKKINYVSDIPVLDISLSGEDVLRAIKLADTYGKSYAIVGFDTISKNATVLCSLLQYERNIITIEHEDEVDEILAKLKKDGYSLVLGDRIVTTKAKQQDMDSILITSGIESIEKTFQSAINFCKGYAGIRTRLHILEKSFSKTSSSYLVFHRSGEIIYESIQVENMEEEIGLVKQLKKELTTSLEAESRKFFIHVKDKIFAVYSYSFMEGMEQYVSYQFWTNEFPVLQGKRGVRIISKEEVEETISHSLFTSLYKHSVDGIVDKMNQMRRPVVIFGEEGTGKKPVASILYMESEYCNHPYIEIDCSLLNAKNWSYLFHHYNSPFTDSHNTIYFHKANLLTLEQQTQLVNLMRDTNLCGRNQVLLSYNLEVGKEIPIKAYEFINQFPCITFALEPLREHAKDIPMAISLYLNRVNEEIGKELIGCEPEAMDLLQNYFWPYNYRQLKRVVRELSLMTTTPYIKSEEVIKVLGKERREKKSLRQAIGVELKDGNHLKTLEQLTKEIISYALQENGGNQSATAKQLGISRSTLWRYLKG